MKVKTEEYIPFITSCKISTNDLDHQWCGGWICHFTIDKDNKNYRMQIFLNEKTQKWVYTTLRFKEGYKYKDDERRYSLWNDHIFHQLVLIIKKHSKDRLRLMKNLDMDYSNDIFEAYHYKMPDNITINEEKTP